ncbi:hypothetical protein ACM64Y_15405 [Novispirillum sp. DQ9]|uniref:hypothetical protein n=1 Tax=Novispirillum sp. DQ9 TaxID=3398612 RepID=UPI003C7E4A83
MSEIVEKVQGPDLSRKLFGGVLDYDGAGYYPGLELLNLVFCCEADILLPQDEPILVRRQAHDFARRLVWDDRFAAHPKRREVLFDDRSEDAVRHLLQCLKVAIPNQSKTPTWERSHFFPYTRSLLHWDARLRGSGERSVLKMERRYLRGGGALVFRILRHDPDSRRLDRVRTGFSQLYEETSNSPLEQLAKVLLDNGAFDSQARPDDIESRCVLFEDQLEELLRDGMANVLSHSELPAAARVRATVAWTGLWLTIAQHTRASYYLGQDVRPIICDCGSGHSQLRRASQRCLKEIQADIVRAAEQAGGADLSSQQKNKLRGFFWATAATMQLLNSWRGRRHFTLGLETLETLVLAATEGSQQLSFEKFVHNWLFGRCGFVAGRDAASDAALLRSLDASIFEDNENRLAGQMQAAGLLTLYSDATRMVGTGGLR